MRLLALPQEPCPAAVASGENSDSRTVDAGRKEDVLPTDAVEAAHLGSEGEVSEEAVGTSPDAARALGVSCCPSVLAPSSS